MNRSQFLKSLALTTGAITLGSFTTLANSLASPQPKKWKMEYEGEQYEEIFIDPNDSEYGSWLANLASKYIIGGLAASIISPYDNSCYCNGTSCSKNNASSSNYTFVNGIYGYSGSRTRSVTQNLSDSNVNFNNFSVPFLSLSNTIIMNVEGPFLAGLCWLARDICARYGTEQAKQIALPRQEIQNGGYRFDADPCYPTEFKNDYGKTKIAWQPHSNGQSGDVRVEVRDEYDNLDFKKTMSVNYA